MAYTAQKMKFSIKDFFRKCDKIRRKLRIWSHLLKKSLMENFIFCAVLKVTTHFNICILFIFVLGKQKRRRVSISKIHKLKNIEESVLSNTQNTPIVEPVLNKGAVAHAVENKAVDIEGNNNKPEVGVTDEKIRTNNEVTNKRNQRIMKARA